jgi:hypothetical protein
MSCIEFYKAEGYGVINEYLRFPHQSNIPLRIKECINDIDAHMKYQPSLKGVPLYRGIRNIDNYIQNGGIVVHLNYASASPDLNSAESFADGQCCVLKFYLPPDIKAYVYENDYEKEVLIQRGVQFTIMENLGENIYSAILSLYKYPEINLSKALTLTKKLGSPSKYQPIFDIQGNPYLHIKR